MKEYLLSNNFDVAIIGSGIGGLTCGAILAQKGLRVCVAEKHFQIGGCAQSFSRKGFTFDSSVHSAPMADDGFICGILHDLGIRKDLRIIPYTNAMQTVTPSGLYSYPRGIAEMLNRFGADFPNEKDSLVALFNDTANRLSIYKGKSKDIEKPLPPSSMSYREYIASFIRNPQLQEKFFTIWPFGGTSPSFAPLFNAFIFYVHTVEGSHYIEGGFSKLADALASVIVNRNGQIKTNWDAQSLTISHSKRATALVNSNSETIRANAFVSNISPYLLHTSVIPESFRNKLWLSRLNNLRPSLSAFCVYCGLQGDAAEFVPNNITLWFAHDDHDSIYKRILSGPPDQIDHLLIMRPPGLSEKSTLTFMYFIRHDAFENWAAAKNALRDAIVSKAKSLIGDFAKQLVVCETATPKTIERYTGNTNGALYGFENIKTLYGQTKLPSTTHIANVYQTGHWTKSGNGMYNVMASAQETAFAVLNS